MSLSSDADHINKGPEKMKMSAGEEPLPVYLTWAVAKPGLNRAKPTTLKRLLPLQVTYYKQLTKNAIRSQITADLGRIRNTALTDSHATDRARKEPGQGLTAHFM
jgi:hypothetical protein